MTQRVATGPGLRIAHVEGWEALDSRGQPTVGCVVTLAGGAQGRARMPAGASKGRHEVAELRDGGRRYDGRGVRSAVDAVNTELAAAVRGFDASSQAEVDAALTAADGTPDLGRLGANSVLAVSIASALAAAAASGLPLYSSLSDGSSGVLLPLPMINIISGGAHAGSAIDVQDFLVVPVGAGSFREALEFAARVRRATGEIFEERGFGSTLVADEGGFAAALPANRVALELLTQGIERAGFQPGMDVAIAIDVAASQLWERGDRYRLRRERRVLTADEILSEIRSWCDDFAVVSVEDPVGEDDWRGWRLARRLLPDVQLIGDDLIATDSRRLQRAVDDDCATAVLVKPNQRGTITATADVMRLARRAGWGTVVSARSGETEDSWLADLAVGWRTGQIKVGSTHRSDRNAKWNRLLEIEALSTSLVEYAGVAALRPVPPVGLPARRESLGPADAARQSAVSTRPDRSPDVDHRGAVRRIAITGANGMIGQILCAGLSPEFEIRPVTRAKAQPGGVIAALDDVDALTRAFSGCAAVIHLAAASGVEVEWEQVLSANIVGTYNVFEAARRAGSRRVVFASTNHVVGLHEVEGGAALYELDNSATVDERAEARPDSLYGASKLFGEALGRFYAEVHSMSVICLRIGSVRPDDDPYGPTVATSAGWLQLDRRGRLLRSRATWLSHRDCVQLFRRALNSSVAWSVAFGTSANPRLIWSLGSAERDLGYRPDDASPQRLPTEESER